MPRISYFYGIAIYMYYRDHAPPHFHAIYLDQQVEIKIDDQEVLVGHLPPRALGMVREWAAKHKSELMRVWDQARNGNPLIPIDPLP